MKARALIPAASVFLFCSMANAAEISVLSTRATEEVYGELVPQFEKASGHKVTTTFTGTQDLQRRIAAGERYDLIIMLDSAIEDFIKSGKVVPGSRADIAKSSIGVGIRAGLPKPDISSIEALKKALLTAKSIGYSTGPSGDYLRGVFQKIGIAEAVKTKLRQVSSGLLVGSIIATGEAEIGFQQANELSHFPGVDYLGPLPAELQDITRRSGGIMVGAREPDAAKALLNFISGPAAAAVIRKHGLDPA